VRDKEIFRYTVDYGGTRMIGLRNLVSRASGLDNGDDAGRRAPHDPNRPPTSLATPNDWKAGRTASSASIQISGH